MPSEQPTQSIIIADEIDYYKVGRQFEEYMIGLFNKQFFTVIDYNKARKIRAPYIPGKLSNPDLTLRLFGRKNYSFAVECKWRSKFYNGKLKWAEYCQIDKYKEFEKEYNIPVFVAIGIGGTSDNPEELFVTPLSFIEKNKIVSRYNLLPYEREIRRRFFYDYEQLALFQHY